ncbi:MAG: 50S ribosomal protein L21 [Acidimicrobiales bacterium]
MYAVIRTGGKQHRVSQGQRLDVERLGVANGDSVSFDPVLVVDGDQVLAGTGALSGASVAAVVVGEAKGPKIDGFTYKAKSRGRKRWGHRQKYTTIEITGITRP